MEKKVSIETIDGNNAAAHVAYAFSEVAAIYPITPSSTMGEMVDAWASEHRKNMFGQVLHVVEMQSEAGAAGALHGSLTCGALTTTFTSSQGLLLMIPNMYKIAGEMLPTVFHIAARSLACQSLSIFGDHSDVMAARQTGFAMLASSSVQEAHDLAIAAHLTTLDSHVPFMHFFDGFRTSSVENKIEIADYETIRSMVNDESISKFRKRKLTSEAPIARVAAQNPDIYFQGRESVNKYYDAIPAILRQNLKKIEQTLGRRYELYEYTGSPDATKIIIAMGSACQTLKEYVNYFAKKGEKIGAINVHLYRPFSLEDFKNAIPRSVKKIAVLDRTKEAGSIGEPLYLDIVSSLQGMNITIIGGRYGLSSKEFTPDHVKSIFDHLDGVCTHGFTVGIIDDVTYKSLPLTETKINTEQDGIRRCKFWGFGSDGTVGANKNSIKIIGNNSDLYVQAYFEYDSKKSGGITISHLRFGHEPILSEYLLNRSDFIALHNPAYIGKYDILEGITHGGIFLLNAAWPRDEAFLHLTEDMQKTIIEREIKFFVIDATKIAKEVGLNGKINTVMQAAFFKISGVLPEDQSIDLIKSAIKKTFEKKGDNIVKMNWAAVDKTSEALVQAKIHNEATPRIGGTPFNVFDERPFTKEVIDPIAKLKGDMLPVSKISFDGSVPTGTSRLEKRGVADESPKWFSEHCIQCGQCSFVCPHAAIRAKQIDPKDLENAPSNFNTIKSNTINQKNLQFRIQVYPEDCVGCGSCVEICPTKIKSILMRPTDELRAVGESSNAVFFDKLANDVLDGTVETSLKGSQFKQPLFEFSGACAGCGETPYIKLTTQLFGDRMIIANATGCSSIYGGTFPTTPYCTNDQGKGPAWANSLFEDNAEYGFGMRLAVDAERAKLFSLLNSLSEKGTIPELIPLLKYAIENFTKVDNGYRNNTKKILELLPKALNAASSDNKQLVQDITNMQDTFIDKSIWIIGGDGWAYDIGYGGLDHVIASGANVNILVLDTEVYSNTGGQSSKSTPMAAIAKFASNGKRSGKKNLGLMAMSYGNVYVAAVSMGKDKLQLLKALTEAEAFNGPSLVIAYSPCIAHGINMGKSQEEMKRAVDSGYWNLYRYDPRLTEKGMNPFQLDSKEPTLSFSDFLNGEIRYKSLFNHNPDEAQKLFDDAEKDAKRRYALFKSMAGGQSTFGVPVKPQA